MALYQCEDEVDRLILQLRASLNKFEDLSVEQQNDRYNEALLLVERIKVAEANYQHEIDGLKVQTKNSHMNRLSEKKQKINELKERLKELGDIVHSNESKQCENLKHSGKLTHTQKLVAWGDDVQDKTQNSLNRIKTLTVTSEKVGADVTQEIERQTESLNRVNLTINAVDENVVNANRTLKEIAKSILRERFMQVLIVLIILLTIAIVLLIVYGKKRSK